MTAAAYEKGDLVPGLPVADGARETAREVLEDAASGRPLFVATLDGRRAGSVRAVIRPDGDWEVRRLAVAPWVRRGGVGRSLLRRLEEAAVTAGAGRVVLDAVVERGNPAFYARAGFRTVRHFGADDKPLSEVHMERDPRRAARPQPYPGDETTGSAPTVSWWAVAGATVARLDSDAPPASDAQWLGADCWTGAPGDMDGAVHDPLAGAADRIAADGTLVFARPAGQISAFVMPRTVHSSLLAWWRSPAARSQRV